MKNSCTGSPPQKPHPCQHCHRQFPAEFPQPKFWFSQLVEGSYTDDETGRNYRRLGVVVGLTLNLLLLEYSRLGLLRQISKRAMVALLNFHS